MPCVKWYFRILSCLHTWHLDSNYPISNHHGKILTERAQLHRWLNSKQCGANSIFVCLQYNVPCFHARIVWQTYFLSFVKYLNIYKKTTVSILDIFMTTRPGDPHRATFHTSSRSRIHRVASLLLPTFVLICQHLGALRTRCAPHLPTLISSYYFFLTFLTKDCWAFTFFCWGYWQ